MVGCLAVAGCSEPADAPVWVPREEAAELVARAQCAARFECECSDPGFEDPESCLQGWTLRVSDLGFVADASGLEYDGSCVARRLEVLQSLQCDATIDPGDPRQALLDCPRPCKAFVGSGDEGAPCDVFGATVKVDDCGQGLVCEEARCVPLCPPPPLIEGERCQAGIETLGRCAAMLVCEPDSGRCVPAPGLGEPCLERLCGPGAFCDRATSTEGICSAVRPPGSACLTDAECESGRCENQQCGPVQSLVCSTPQTL